MSRYQAILAALRAEDYIDIGNNPGEDEQYEELARSIDTAMAAAEMEATGGRTCPRCGAPDADGYTQAEMR